MKFSKSDGFTIIEMLLFIALTGLLVASVLATTSGVIDAQRYKDSTSSLKSMLQMQYSNAINVDNQRPTDNSCASTTSTTSTDAGQSECMIWGRIIKFDGTSTSSQITSRYIISDAIGDATPDNIMSLSSYNSDAVVFEKFKVKEPSGSILPADDYDMEWGTLISEVLKPDGTPANKFTMLIIRSPLTGVLKTYILPEAPAADLYEFIKKAENPVFHNKYLDLCVNPDGLINDGIRQTAVRVYTTATSASGIELIGDSAGDNNCDD